MVKTLDIDFGTTPESIVEHFARINYYQPSDRSIPEYFFKDLAKAIEEYASFQVGVEMAGEDI